jgi:hypothetical protein
MRLVIDALELCYAREHINTFVIASGDSDFCPLAYKLRENDRYVIGLAVKEATSPFFVRACDEFIYLRGAARVSEAIPRNEARPADKSSPSSLSSPSRPADKAPGAAPPGGRKPREIPEIARQVVSNLLSRATAPLNPSFIKETIVRREPDFDEREHGFSTFSRLLEALEKEGLLKRQQQGRQWYVVSTDTPDTTPEADDEDL